MPERGAVPNVHIQNKSPGTSRASRACSRDFEFTHAPALNRQDTLSWFPNSDRVHANRGARLPCLADHQEEPGGAGLGELLVRGHGGGPAPDPGPLRDVRGTQGETHPPQDNCASSSAAVFIRVAACFAVQPRQRALVVVLFCIRARRSSELCLSSYTERASEGCMLRMRRAHVAPALSGGGEGGPRGFVGGRNTLRGIPFIVRPVTGWDPEAPSQKWSRVPFVCIRMRVISFRCRGASLPPSFALRLSGLPTGCACS